MSIVLEAERKTLDLYADAWRESGQRGSPFIVDVGANVGEWAMEARARFQHAAILCFEPQAGAHRILLQRALSDMNLTAVRMGLSSVSREAVLHASHHPDSLQATLTERPDAHNYHGSGLALDREETILLTTLERYAEDEPLPRIDFLKLDVEGHEYAVLKGADSFIWGDMDDAIGVIQFEWNDCAHHAGISWGHMLDLLHPHYTIYREYETGVKRISNFNTESNTEDTRNYLAVHWSIDWFPGGNSA